MKRTLCILCVLLAVLPPLSACQPTPEEDVVVNKGDGTMEAAVAAPAAAPYRYEAPERWVETFIARDQTVRIDAGVEVPDDEYHPVLLVERRSFDAQQAVDYYTALFGEGVELRENQYSYAEVLTDLQNTMKGMFVEIDPETGEQIWAPYEGQEEEIARLQQLLAETPAEDTFVPLTAEAMALPLTEGMLRLPDGSSMYPYVTSSRWAFNRYRMIVVQNENWVMQGEATPGEPAHALENIRITEEEAVAMGDEVVAALGGGGRAATGRRHPGKGNRVIYVQGAWRRISAGLCALSGGNGAVFLRPICGKQLSPPAGGGGVCAAVAAGADRDAGDGGRRAGFLLDVAAGSDGRRQRERTAASL